MARGIIETVQLAATLLFAIPVGLFGLDTLRSGDPLLGGLFLAIAVGMVLLQQYLTTPTDVPAAVAEKAAGALVKDEKREK